MAEGVIVPLSSETIEEEAKLATNQQGMNSSCVSQTGSLRAAIAVQTV